MSTEYNFTAKIYDPFLYFAIKPIRITVTNALLKYKKKSILDLCCGTGNQLKFLSKNGFKNLHCLDISKSMLEIAQKNNYPIKFYHEDATKTSFENETFDIVIISFAIHEKDRRTQENIINEVYRIIKKNGMVLIVDFVFDHKTMRLGRIAINLIEKIAGGEHYLHFKNYIQNNGLFSLIEKDKFKLIKSSRKLFNGITISTYQKVFTSK